MPPSNSPSAAPAPDTAAYTPSARLRSSPSLNSVVIRDSAVGDAIAPPTPWTARPISRSGKFTAMPAAKLPTLNRARPTMNIRRRPRMSPIRPPSSSKPPKASE